MGDYNPDEALKRMLELAPILISGRDESKKYTSPNLSESELAELGSELAELVDTLDCWIRKGGCLPSDWHPEDCQPSDPRTF
jgi:hypothetical protein